MKTVILIAARGFYDSSNQSGTDKYQDITEHSRNESDSPLGRISNLKSVSSSPDRFFMVALSVFRRSYSEIKSSPTHHSWRTSYTMWNCTYGIYIWNKARSCQYGPRANDSLLISNLRPKSAVMKWTFRKEWKEEKQRGKVIEQQRIKERKQATNKQTNTTIRKMYSL